MTSNLRALAAAGKPRRAGAICAGSWAIIAADPEREADKLAGPVLYQSNAYIDWGAFGPSDQVPRYPDGRAAIRGGLYELWDADQAVRQLVAMLRAYPEIIDVHFWAQFPGEAIESGSARMEYVARSVLPRVRAELQPREEGTCKSGS
jgi:hypothetical protein